MVAFCELMKPTMSGTLARWQGLKTMLTTPQANAARSAQPSDWSSQAVEGAEDLLEHAPGAYCVVSFVRPCSTSSASMSACG